jgi:hypothetical protein
MLLSARPGADRHVGAARTVEVLLVSGARIGGYARILWVF